MLDIRKEILDVEMRIRYQISGGSRCAERTEKYRLSGMGCNQSKFNMQH